MPKVSVPWAVLALVTLLLAPIAAADHVYSHQYRVFGRVVDAEGNPLQGAVVFMELKKTQDPDKISFRTDCMGDYGFASNEHFHHHGLSTVAELHLTVFDPSDPEPLATKVVPADRNLRKTHVDWRLDDPGDLRVCDGAADNLTRTAFVYGRLWNSTDEQRLEQITVWGEIPGVPQSCSRDGAGNYRCQEIDVEVTTGDGRTETVTAWMNNYGDYFAWVEFEAPYETATAKATWLDKTVEVPVDPVFRTAEADFVQGELPQGRAAPAGALVGAVLALAAGALVVRKR